MVRHSLMHVCVMMLPNIVFITISCADGRVLIDFICSFRVFICIFYFSLLFHFSIFLYSCHVSCLTVYVYCVFRVRFLK